MNISCILDPEPTIGIACNHDFCLDAEIRILEELWTLLLRHVWS